LYPHQFGILTFGGCETIILSILVILDLHPDWVMMQIDVKNAFNDIFQVVVFKKLCDAKGLLVKIVPFIGLFLSSSSMR
jgi:hypothetical protein